MDLALNNLQWLICHKTKPNQMIIIIYNAALGSSAFYSLLSSTF